VFGLERYLTREVFSFTTETNESEETYTVYIDNNNTEGPWDGTSEHPYRSIQAGIDAVSIGGTVIVNNGTYNENLVITKSVNVIGAGAETTIVKNLNSDHVFYVTADRVNISGFTIEEAGFSKKAGICIDGADYCHISSNNVLNNYYGVRLKSSNSNILTGNNVFSNTKCGIFLEDSSSNTLVGNNVLSNTNGIYLTGSSGNTITGNNVSGNTNGIYFEVSSSNALTGNNVSGNTTMFLVIQMGFI
jgi:parallel beta-helix repeat protein